MNQPKLSWFRTSIASLLIVGISLLPVRSLADTCSDARAMADRETSGILWFAAGCLLGILGVVGAYVLKPDPPASALVGKSADYVATYTDCFKDEAKGIQTKNAWIGCGAIGVLYIVYFVVIAAAVTSTVP